MQKNSTHFPNASFIPHDKKDMKEISSLELPSDAVIQNIINFSKALKISKSREVGLIEIILN
ncbi:MAG: hypothetical protein HY841_06105 [Bacteroidetes bacterium]|nr:hypothetical protein [Bacteroidota bacterium]